MFLDFILIETPLKSGVVYTEWDVLNVGISLPAEVV